MFFWSKNTILSPVKCFYENKKWKKVPLIQTQRLQAVVADMREKVIWVWATKVLQVTRLAQNVWHTPLITLWTIGVKRWHWSWHWHCFLGVWDVHIYHSLALNIWLSVNRTQLERHYKFVIIGSHLALWDSPDKPAQTSYFLSNPLLSFHQPLYTFLLAYQRLLGYFWISASFTMLVMA